MNYQFSYLVGALLFDAAWLACCFIGKRYRPQIVWGTVITTPLTLTSFLILHFMYPNKNIYSTAIAFAACALVVAFLRRDLIPTMLIGAAVFTILYFLLFVYFLALYPDFIERYYNLSNVSNIRFRGVPIEELMFASTGGAVWSVAYEYFQGYRFAPAGGFRLVEI